MRRFESSEITAFLKCLDSHLKRPFTMIVIGGAAAGLAYHALDYTRDIDTMNDTREIEDAYEKAKQETRLSIKTLVSRFKTEMTHVSGNKIRIQQNFLAAIERTFGEKTANKLAKEINYKN